MVPQSGVLACHDAEIRLCFKRVEHLDDVFVPEALENLYLLPEALNVLLALAMLHDELHGRDLARLLPPALVDLMRV